MSALSTICPYTGLRSFTEEESLYFKGRDIQVDQVTALLEQNKFLMVTGASGEGKSSLIYGGLIPNARAGFFKAPHTQWIVADFRPERSPVKNLAKALADKFGSNPATIETELRRGFSSLVDLYLNSEFYIDEQDDHWKILSEADKKEKKRKAANLLVLVDQFEEFFTNPENFYNERLSQDSQIVVNLVLESARIAQKRNLPLYIVCTMRSDFIGQCSAFRGLPEYIGFSQFFVPRLKRKDLKQVIEDPAILSGNRITQRLIERLVFDLADGIDQLPILQHALSQVWLAADHGREEMDLIHYAMVGGMPASELPDEDQRKFLQWFDALPENKRAYFQNTGLSKVIEIHANTLYEDAWEYCNAQNSEKSITKKEAKRIVAMTFACLTKIDNSRAVRNLMSIKEITDIINTPGITVDVVDAVLGIYREEGNAFIRPFRTEEPSTHKLTPETVLDITHESLIRNWNKLDEWARTEFEYYNTFQDLSIQLQRWKSNDKANGYLLPIGPLTYFENWYSKCKPNVGWIKRYADNPSVVSTTDSAEQLDRNANDILSDTSEFLKKSARKVTVTRAFMKYGTQRIAAVLAIAVMLVFSGFYWYDAEQKRNERVIRQARDEAKSLLASKELNTTIKADYLIAEERFSPGSLLSHLGELEPKEKSSLSIETYKELLTFGRHWNNPIKGNLIEFTSRTLLSPEFEKDKEFALINRNKFMVLLAGDEYYNPSELSRKTLADLANANKRLVIQLFKEVKTFKAGIPTEVNLAIQFWLTFSQPGDQDLDQLINLFSPLEGEQPSAVFNTYYPKGSFEYNGREPLDFNGGYHTLASLYAGKGDIDKITSCIDFMLKAGDKSYLQLARVFNNHIGLIGYLYQYDHRDKAPLLMKWISDHSEGNPPITLLRNAVIRAGYINHLYYVNVTKQTRSFRGNLYFNLCLSDRKVYDALMEDYEAAILEVKDADERNYLLAINSKRKGMFLDKYCFDRGLPRDQAQLNRLFENALKHYRLVDENYLGNKIVITIPYNVDGVRERTHTRNQLFVYPDYMDGWFCRPYHTDAFFRFQKENNLLQELYKTRDDLDMLHLWIAKAFECMAPFIVNNYNHNNFPLPNQNLEDILEFVNVHKEGKYFGNGLPLAILANRFLAAGDSIQGLVYSRALTPSSLQQARNRYEYLEKSFLINQIKSLSINLVRYKQDTEAVAFAETIKEDYMRVYSYLFMAEEAYRADTSAVAFAYLDSVYSINKRIDLDAAVLDNRFNLVRTLSYIGGNQLNEMSMEILRDFSINQKAGGIISMVSGLAREGSYYKALMVIPPTFTETQDLICRLYIIYEASRRSEDAVHAAEWKGMDDLIGDNEGYINYVF